MGPARLSYNPYFSACFLSRNNIFLSQQINRNNILTCFFSEVKGPITSSPCSVQSFGTPPRTRCKYTSHPVVCALVTTTVYIISTRLAVEAAWLSCRKVCVRLRRVGGGLCALIAPAFCCGLCQRRALSNFSCSIVVLSAEFEESRS